jgi:imidazole glycerol-phosphate synthase subunit HisH
LHAVTHLGYAAEYARSAEDIADATHIILPGVGSARATMDSLREMDILRALEEQVLRAKTLFLGICVGLQILFERSEEEDAACLGWLRGRVVRFDAARVPQMGWNEVRFVRDVPFPAAGGFFYFVNSYHAVPEDAADLWGEADYNGRFTAAVRHDNIYATQFHIEKSGKAGLALLRGFLETERARC